MRKEFRTKLKGDDSRADASAYFTLPLDTRDVWGRAKVPVKVTINGCTWRSTVGNCDGQQYIVVNAEARRNAGVRTGDLVTITLEPDTEKREIEVPILRRTLGAKLTQKLNALSRTYFPLPTTADPCFQHARRPRYACSSRSLRLALPALRRDDDHATTIHC